jgi:hypothetical protein
MTRFAKLMLGAVALGVGGAITYAVVSGGGNSSGGNDGGGNGGQDPPPKQDETLVKYGYKILPNCSGFEVVDIQIAANHARDLVHEAPEGAWQQAVEDELYGPVCQVLDAGAYQALVKKNPDFFYRIRHAVMQGAVDKGYLTEADANLQLAQVRDAWAAFGVDKAKMVPETVYGE